METTIIYGSETGNCEGLAQKAQDYLTQNGITANVMGMENVSADKLPGYKKLLVITSTWGDGDPPDNAIKLHGELTTSTSLDLSGVNYAVFAIGQSFYDQFCKTGKDFDEYLSRLGANRMRDIELSDDDYDESFQPWLEEVKAHL